MQEMPQLRDFVDTIWKRRWTFDTLTKLGEGFKDLTDPQKEMRAGELNAIIKDCPSEQIFLSKAIEKGYISDINSEERLHEQISIDK